TLFPSTPPFRSGQGIALAALEQAHRLLILEPPRILLQGLLKALESPFRPVLLDVTEPELEGRVFEARLQAERLLELLDRAADLPLLAKHGAQQHVRGGNRRHVDGSR